MNNYEFAYFGPSIYHVKAVIAAWCEEHDCRLETTALIAGARFRISGPEDAIRDAIPTARTWIRSAA